MIVVSSAQYALLSTQLVVYGGSLYLITYENLQQWQPYCLHKRGRTSNPYYDGLLVMAQRIQLKSRQRHRPSGYRAMKQMESSLPLNTRCWKSWEVVHLE